MRKSRIMLIMLGIILGCLTLLNASWLAPAPDGTYKVIAHRGVYHLYNKRAAFGRDTCTAQYIYPPEHEVFENTIPSVRQAANLGADIVEADVAPTKDGEMVLFHDWTVDCRTEGKGETRDLTLTELKALDIGHGYTADGGKTYPLRGKGVGLIPTVQEVITANPKQPLLFNFKSKNAREADQLFTILKAAGRNSTAIGDSFYGHENPVGRMRKLLPEAWTFASSEMKGCTLDYAKWGWLGIMPDSCKDGTIFVPVNYRWAFWGWPNRFLARMKANNVRVVIFGPHESGKSNEGLSKPEQLEAIPEGFGGYVWVEDIRKIGPALRR